MTEITRTRPLSYSLFSPGYEGVYTGRKTGETPADGLGPCIFEGDGDGNEIMRWSLWSWTGTLDERDWDDDIKHINLMKKASGR
ncbi:MAG: hypothetical protein JW941_01585 [Candidatus Coatesbacteria bacterium]|nr:hypothetical protein [Candidatus Coatesbacteria bacterium]